MEAERVERLWQAVMNVAAEMRREGLDTGNAIPRLRDAKVLLNHCIHDEHAHGDELLRAEMAVEDAQAELVSILNRIGRLEDFSFEPPRRKRSSAPRPPPPRLLSGRKWARIRIKEGMDLERIASLEGVEFLESGKGYVTLVGDEEAVRRALAEISKEYESI